MKHKNFGLIFSGNLPTTGNYAATQLYDMNVDGFMDVCAFGYGTFTLWLGDGTGNWTQDAQFYTPPFGYYKAFRVGGDIDHNGFPDIVLVSNEGSWPSYQNHLHCYKETSIADSLNITPIFPRGNEKFVQFSTQFIDWMSAVPVGEQSFVKLEYSISGSNGPWITLADSLPNNGRYQWVVPEANSLNCYIKYTAWTTNDTKTAITPSPFVILGGSTEVDNIPTAESRFFLQSYPNPFFTRSGSTSGGNQQTKVKFSIPKDCFVELKIYDIKGKLVKMLVNNMMSSGYHNIFWNGRDCNNKIIPTGIYFYQIITKEFTATKKLLVIN